MLASLLIMLTTFLDDMNDLDIAPGARSQAPGDAAGGSERLTDYNETGVSRVSSISFRVPKLASISRLKPEAINGSARPIKPGV